MIAPPSPLHRQKSEKIDLRQLYPDLDEASNLSLRQRANRMFDEAERFDADNLTTSAERSLETASLLETELNRRISLEREAAKAQSVRDNWFKSVPRT